MPDRTSVPDAFADILRAPIATLGTGGSRGGPAAVTRLVPAQRWTRTKPTSCLALATLAG